MLIDAFTSIKTYWRHPTNLIALEFGVVSFSFTTIHNIFMLYFIDLFLFHYGLKLYWLWISQVCFVVWNFSSNYILGNPKESSIYEMTVTYGGPVLAVVFVVPFVFGAPVSATLKGVYFTFFLCLYDTIFNRVLLSRSIWLQENVVHLKDKLKIHFLGFIFASASSCAVFPGYIYYSLSNGVEQDFRWFCLLISMLSFFGFIFSSFCQSARDNDKSAQSPSSSSSSSSSPSPKSPNFHSKASASPPPSPSHSSHSHSSSSSTQTSSLSTPYNKYNYPRNEANSNKVDMGALTRNVSSHWNMIVYVLVNVLQVFSSTFSVVFLHLFIAYHVNTSKSWQATILFICFFSPVVMNIALSVIANKRATYELLKFLFQAKIGISVFALVFGSHLLVAALFTIFSRAIVESVFGLLMFVNQDVDNEHHVKFGYRKVVSQRLVAIGKIGQAAAPIVGVLSFALDPSESTVAYNVSPNRLFYSTILVMLLSGSLQLYVWSKYTLHGTYLKEVNIMAKGKFSPQDMMETGRGMETDVGGGYVGESEVREREREGFSLRSSFGDTFFSNNTPSPNLSSIATISHKQVITVA